MENNAEKLWKMLDNRKFFGFNPKALVSLIYVLYAWKIGKYSEDHSFSSFYQGELTGKKLTIIFKSLSLTKNLFKAYLKLEGEPSKFSSHELATVFNFVNETSVFPKVGYAFGMALGKIDKFSLLVPDEFGELAIKLICKDAKTVYSPFTQSINFVYSYPDRIFYLEDKCDNSLLIELIKEIDNIELNYSVADPLINPSFTKAGASHLLESFDVGLSFPPFNFRTSKIGFHIDDIFQRFSFFKGKGSLEIAFIEHLLAQVSKKAVISLPVGMTFRSGLERDFRSFLLKKNLVDAVIQLPPGLFNSISIESILLVIDKRRTSDEVLFINAKNEMFRGAMSRKNTLINIDQIIEIFDERRVLENVSNSVSRECIVKNHYSFAIDRYILSNEAKQIRKSLMQFPYKKLEEIADLKLSQTVKETEDGEEIFEVSPGDIPDSGYVQASGRLKKIDMSSSRYKTYKLNPFDVLLSTKGTIGKVGIVNDKADFLASQAFQIIRPKGGIDDAKYLYLIFKSKQGQSLLEQYSSGSIMPQISTNVLSKLEIPWFTPEKRKRIIKAFEKEMQLYEEIDKLKAEVRDLHDQILKE